MDKLWNKYGAEIMIAAILLVVWKLWGFFSALGNLGNTVGAGLSGAMANMQQTSKEAQERAAVRAINPNATPADLAKFEADANALAAATGGKSIFGQNGFTVNWSTAYGLAKNYSRIITRTDKYGKVVVIGERKDALRLAVLVPFYDAATDGRSLVADLDRAMQFAPAAQRAFYAKYIK